MVSGVLLIGEHPLAKDASGKLRSRIGTVFPELRLLVTLPGIHAMQRQAALDWIVEQRRTAGLPPLTREEESDVWNSAVDLIMEDDGIQIRPDPDDMPLAFQADRLLQQIVSKRQIKFLHALNEKVRTAIKQRGECWRITPLPTVRGEMRQRIQAAKIAILGREIYYYNSTTGTRILTYDEFARLELLPEDQLRLQLAEVQRHSASRNHQHYPEISFFTAEDFSAADFAGIDFPNIPADELARVYAHLKARFHDAVRPEYRVDDHSNAVWRNRMFSALIAERDEHVSEEMLLGLSPEFYMQIHWLPGARLVNGQLLFDEVLEEEGDPSHGFRAGRSCDKNVRDLFYNLIREYDDLEYINIGRVVNSLSRGRPSRGRRDVYIAVLKQRGAAEETVSIIRMQKWGVREHLDRGLPLEKAMYESEEYTEYILDRRTGCRHLGLNIPAKITSRKICEPYVAPWTGPSGIMIWSPYFERAYVPGIATDKMPRHRFADPQFSERFARLLGRAAAPNLIVGRCDIEQRVLFDDGDEVVLEDAQGMPLDIVVADQTGTFNDYRRELAASAIAYAGPVNRRLEYLPNPERFAAVYLAAFVERFEEIQLQCQQRWTMLQTMFENRRYDERGSFACRWHCVLDRLARSDPRELEERIRIGLGVTVPC